MQHLSSRTHIDFHGISYLIKILIYKSKQKCPRFKIENTKNMCMRAYTITTRNSYVFIMSTTEMTPKICVYAQHKIFRDDTTNMCIHLPQEIPTSLSCLQPECPHPLNLQLLTSVSLPEHDRLLIQISPKPYPNLLLVQIFGTLKI